VETVGKFLAVALGGSLGAIARYTINNSFLASVFVSFPFPTFFINVTGSFFIGFLLTLATERVEIGENLRLFLTVGFLGAYTTYSTFEFETFQLIRERQYLTSLFYAISSVAIGFVGVLGGVWLARKF
jgi:CrcB protein